MKRREFLRTLGIGATALSMPGILRAAAPESEKPNILFIFADDQCFETIRAFGLDEIQTPNLDRLVKRGVTFSHAYNMGAWHGAVCVASRTMLNTGRFLWHAKEIEPRLRQEAAQGRLWSQYMAGAGYDTYMSGKWHVKIDPPRIFQNVVNVRPGMPNQTPEGYDRPKKGEPDPWKPWDESRGGYWKGGKHWSEVLADDAESFLQQAAGRSNPFFMYLAFNAPHDPRQSPKEYVERYPLKGIAVPENYLPLYPDKDAIGCGERLRDERLAPFPRTEYAVKVHRQEYYAIITHMDTVIGRILDELENTGKADNTYIFFTADHGLACGHHGLLGKQNMYDHSVRVPLIAVGPGVEGNTKIDVPVYLQDIMPSSLDLAGVSIPEQVQFKSLMPLIRGEREQSYDAIYGGYMSLQRMVTEGDYKMLYYPKIEKTKLFNLKNDPKEMIDLAGEPGAASRIAKLKETLRRLQKETGDTLPIE